MKRRRRLLITCEHGGHRLPAEFAERFQGEDSLLESHRGWDPGALPLARALAERFNAPIHASTITRLVVDLNRSPTNPRAVSAFMKTSPRVDRHSLIAGHHDPHWRAVRRTIDELLSNGNCVMHIGVHSFAPVLRGRTRTADIAWLYDPARPVERAFAVRWRACLHQLRPDLRMRMNYPYRGTDDGLTTALRRLYPLDQYAGIELEVNQALLRPSGRRFEASVERAITESLVSAMEDD